MQQLDTHLDPTWDQNKRRPDHDLLESLIGTAALSTSARSGIVRRAVGYVQAVRSGARPGLMEAFLAEYGLSSDEGVALMCLAEALLRIPDARTIDALIDDKIAGSDWSEHLGQSGSLLVNSSTLGLLLAGQVLNTRADDGGHSVTDTLQGLARRMGTPAIRAAVSTVIKQMGRQFVLGETIQAAMTRAAREEAQGFTFSYDMLGEAALTAADADRFRLAYQDAIAAIAARCTAAAVADNPGISIKLSALHPRYEVAQADRVLAELVPVVVDLARRAATAGMGLNIDAEEADRLGLSLAVIEAALSDPSLSGWDGFGVVVQGYGRRAGEVIDGLYAMAGSLDRRLMVRLVKGVLGHRNQARSGRRPRRLSCLHPKACLGCQLHRPVAQAARHDRPPVPPVCDPQRPLGRRHPRNGRRGRNRPLRVSALAWHGRGALPPSGGQRRGAMPRLRTGWRAP